MIRVLMNLSSFVPNRAMGAQSFVAGILENGAQFAPNIELEVVSTEASKRWLGQFNVDVHLLGSPPVTPLGHLALLRRFRKYAAQTGDIVWSPLNQSSFSVLPEVVTVHDLSSRHYLRNAREYHLSVWEVATLFAKYLRLMRSIRHAHAVVAISDSTRREIESVRPNTPVHVVPNGVASHALSLRSGASQRSGVLGVGLRAMHKDGALFVDLAEGFPDRSFTVVGIRDAVRVPPNLTVLGRVSDSELHALYATSEVVVCPSRYEGFGLPVVEAAVAGAKVVASDIPAHREVSSGREVFFFHPGSVVDARVALLHAFDADPNQQTVSPSDWRDVPPKYSRVFESVASGARGDM